MRETDRHVLCTTVNAMHCDVISFTGCKLLVIFQRRKSIWISFVIIVMSSHLLIVKCCFLTQSMLYVLITVINIVTSLYFIIVNCCFLTQSNAICFNHVINIVTSLYFAGNTGKLLPYFTMHIARGAFNIVAARLCYVEKSYWTES